MPAAVMTMGSKPGRDEKYDLSEDPGSARSYKLRQLGSFSNSDKIKPNSKYLDEEDIEIDEEEEEDLNRIRAQQIIFEDPRLLNAAGPSRWPMFWFPININAWGLRIGSAISFLFCAVAILFRERHEFKYFVAGIFGDFCLRALAGSGVSPLGAVGELLGSRLKVRIVEGAPMQFHAMLCSLLAALAVAALSAPNPLTFPAAAILAILGLFCLGELFQLIAGAKLFRLLITTGFIDEDSMKKAAELKEETEFAVKEDQKIAIVGAPVTVVVSDGGVARPTDLKYKKSTEDSKKNDFHPVKHLQPTHLLPVASVSALAMCYKRANLVFDSDRGLTQGLNVVAAVAIFVHTILLACKLKRYPKRIRREWEHPIFGNMFSLLPMCVVILAYLCTRWRELFARILFWVGTSLQLVVSAATISRWMTHPKYFELVDMNWLLPLAPFPVIAYTSVFIIDTSPLRGDLIEMGWLAVGASVFLFLPILSLALYRQTLHHHPWEDRYRFSTFLALCIPGGGAAAISVLGTTDSANFPTFDPIGKLFLGTSWILVLLLFALTCRSFFSRAYFSVWNWFTVFPTAMHALATIEYANYISSAAATSAAHVSLALTTVLCLLCAIHSLGLISKKKWFVSEHKMCPLDFNRSIHAALRAASSRLVSLSRELSRDKPERTQAFLKHLQLLKLTHNEHTNAEDRALFPEINLWFNGTTLPADAEHIRDHLAFDQLFEQATVMRLVAPNDSEFQSVVDRIQEMCVELNQHINDHLDGEEMNIDPIIRKFIPIYHQKKIVRHIFECTDLKTWAIILPFILSQAPLHRQRIQLVKCWRWGMPDKLQLVGRLIYHNLTPLMWEQLTSEVPELIPRGLPGWSKLW